MADPPLQPASLALGRVVRRFSPPLQGIATGSVTGPTRSQASTISLSMEELQALLDSHRKSGEDHAERQWKHRLELTVSALSENLDGAETEAKRLRDENAFLKMYSVANLKELDRLRGMLGRTIDGEAGQPSGGAAGLLGDSKECAVCYATPDETALKGDRLNVYYCGNGCPNVLCHECMDHTRFSRRCLFCRTSSGARLQGRKRPRRPTVSDHARQGSPRFIPSPAYDPDSPAYRNVPSPPSPAYSPSSPSYSNPQSPVYTPTPPSYLYADPISAAGGGVNDPPPPGGQQQNPRPASPAPARTSPPPASA